jgi:antirestriction protein ArdC
LTHWTGHASRLNRPGITEPIRFGSERYSREELTAEMGAAFLCAMTGTDVPVAENQAAYIAGWLRHICDGSAADVIRAAADAQRAADFLTGAVRKGSSFSGGAAGRASLLPVVAAERRSGSSRCPGSRTPSLARYDLAA